MFCFRIRISLDWKTFQATPTKKDLGSSSGFFLKLSTNSLALFIWESYLREETVSESPTVISVSLAGRVRLTFINLKVMNSPTWRIDLMPVCYTHHFQMTGILHVLNDFFNSNLILGKILAHAAVMSNNLCAPCKNGLRRPFRVNLEDTTFTNDCSHGFTFRREIKHLNKCVLWMIVPYKRVILAQVKHELKKSTFCSVTGLPRKALRACRLNASQLNQSPHSAEIVFINWVKGLESQFCLYFKL